MTDDTMLRSARNGFLVCIVGLLAVGMYQIAVEGSVSLAIGGVWVAGVVAYYGSKVYYERA